MATQLNNPIPLPSNKGNSCAACRVRHLAVCSMLDGGELDRLSALLTTIELAQGEPLFDEGEPATHVFNLTAGMLKLCRLLPDGRRQITGFLFPGDFLGLADRDDYICSAQAVTDVALCRFQRVKLENLFKEIPDMEHCLLGMARYELAESLDHMLLLGRKSAKERIASFIMMLSDRAVKRGLGANPVAVPMSRNDIADFLGLTTETVSRTISNLRRNGIIGTETGRKISITDMGTLSALADCA
ncbi:MAG: helix-turn-helix domain-containing protein [Alphaproteobacteria bacterium]